MCTEPEEEPLFFTSAPLGLSFPKYPEVPPPSLDIIPTSDWENKISPISSAM